MQSGSCGLIMRARGGVVQEILLRRWNFPDVKEAKKKRSF